MLRNNSRQVLAKALSDCERCLHDAVYAYEQIPPYDDDSVDVSAMIDWARKRIDLVVLCLLDGSTRFIDKERNGVQ